MTTALEGSLPRPGARISLILVLAGSAVACICAVYAHFHLSGQLTDYRGALSLLDRLFDFLLAGALGVASFCAGRATAQLLSLDFAGVSEEVSFSAMIGVGVIGLGLLGLGLAGLLTPVAIWAFVALLVALCAPQAARLGELMRRGWDYATSTRARCAAALVFAVFVGLLALRTATPPHNLDEAIYHLPVAKLFAREGRVFPVCDNWAGNLPFLVQMIYAACVAAKADIAAKLFSLGLTIATAFAIYGFCVRFLGRRVGGYAIFAFFGAGMVIEVAVTARVDVTLAGVVFLATYAMINYLDSDRPGWLYVSGLLSGVALGIKYTAVIWVALLPVMLIAERVTRRPLRVSALARQCVAYAVVVLAVGSPWYIKNLIWFHNPMYPLVTGEVADVNGGRVRYFEDADVRRMDAHLLTARFEDPERVQLLQNELDKAASRRTDPHHPFRFWEYFTKPSTYSTAAESFHDPNYLFVLFPLILFFRRQRWVLWLGVLSVGFYLGVASASWSARNFLPVYPALTVVVAFVLVELSDRLEKRVPIIRALPFVVVIMVVASGSFVSASQIHNMRSLDFFVGAISRREFMSTMFYYPAISFINRELPPDARVMMIGAQMSYDLERAYVADVNLTATEWQRILARSDSLEEAHKNLRDRGITHILLFPSLFKHAARVGIRDGLGGASVADAGPDSFVLLRTWATIDSFCSKFTEPIYADKMGYTIYLIKP